MSVRLAQTLPVSPTLPAEALEALRAQAAKGQTLAWLALPTPEQPGRFRRRSAAAPSSPRLVWLGWEGESALVVVGGGEQQVPGLVEAAEQGHTITLTLRASDTNARLMSWPTRAQILDPQTNPDQWQQAARTLAGLRLNGPVASLALPAVWKEHATILRLDPLPAAEATSTVEHPALANTGSTLPETTLAAPPAPTPATTRR